MELTGKKKPKLKGTSKFKQLFLASPFSGSRRSTISLSEEDTEDQNV